MLQKYDLDKQWKGDSYQEFIDIRTLKYSNYQKALLFNVQWENMGWSLSKYIEGIIYMHRRVVLIY